MTFTYSSTALSTNLSQVRLKLGDTNSKDPLLTDEEIAAVSDYTAAELAATTGVNIPLAASRCIQAMIAAVARRIDTTGPRFGATRSQIFQHFKDLKKMLEDEARSSTSAVAWSEHSIDDADSLEDDSDFSNPSFGVGQFDNVTDEET